MNALLEDAVVDVIRLQHASKTVDVFAVIDMMCAFRVQITEGRKKRGTDLAHRGLPCQRRLKNIPHSKDLQSCSR